MKHRTLQLILFCLFSFSQVQAQESVARLWNEVMLEAIRNDYARPTVHARNLWHSSVLMYDAWAVFDTNAEPYFLGQTVGNFTCNFAGVPEPSNIDDARIEAMSYAMFRLIEHRFEDAPGNNTIIGLAGNLMFTLGFNPYYQETIYQGGDYKALGNYMAECMISFGLSDGSNELDDYENQTYLPVNAPLVTQFEGNPDMVDPNRWQPLTLEVSIDQSGNPTPTNTPPFLSPEWGQVIPFALKEEDKTVYLRDGEDFDYNVYHDPGPPPYLDTMAVGGLSEEYKWGFSLVSIWSSHLDPEDTTMIDISPAGIGNVQDYPTTVEGLRDFYNLFEGGDPGEGRDLNPSTQLPYEPQVVKRADYGRVLAEFWADGPSSETPPGHWYTILNYVTDNMTVKRFNGQGPALTDLEYDVKGYFMLGGAMHDVAITTWGIKGWYDYLRPISALRYMMDKGQSSDENLPSYHPAGILLQPGYIELVMPGDTLAGANDENVGKIKCYSWKGPDYITDPETDVANVGWILGENWWPYQRPSFVTTFSRAAANVLTELTGDTFFPGGMGEFVAEAETFLVFEKGPTEEITLQWATYQDAADQCSLSRIWGGIHPPCDDIPGRLIGNEISEDVYNLAKTYFYRDEDADGYYSFEDCNDLDNTIYPGAPELCDGKDNDCNDEIDEGLDIFTYYIDADNDGYGDAAISKDTCQTTPITGYVANLLDCDDNDAMINPDAIELCDGIDNNCSGMIDDNLDVFTYYLDADSDGYGDAAVSKDTCQATPIAGYVANMLDCNDDDPTINPDATEICDGIDNNCSGTVDDNLEVFTYYLDADNDGYGDPMMGKDTCQNTPITGYVTDDSDCDDTNPQINPNAIDVVNNGIDEDCDGVDFTSAVHELTATDIKIFPNPVTTLLQIQTEVFKKCKWTAFDITGRVIVTGNLQFAAGKANLNFTELEKGIYILVLEGEEGRFVSRLVKF